MAIIPDWTLLLQIANFVVLILILNAVLYRPIRHALIERQKTVRRFEGDIDTLRKSAAESDETFQSGIAQAKSQGFKEGEALKQAAEQEEKRLINEINEKAQAHLAEVRAQIAKEAGTARDKLSAEAGVFSMAIAQKILGRKVS